MLSGLGAGLHIPGTAQLIPYQEKIFVHLDRNYYLSGEKIRFTVYCIEAFSRTPSAVSQVAALEVFDPDGQAMIRQKVSLVNGVGSGALQIPAECNSGPCLLRAYTSWQRNDGPGNYGYIPLMIIDPERPLHQNGRTGQGPRNQTNETPARDPSPSARTEYRMRFYPEGGALVAGVENHVVFTVTDDWGVPVDFHGVIGEPDTEALEEIYTRFPGIGSFHWTPLPGKTGAVYPVDDFPAAPDDSLTARKDSPAVLKDSPADLKPPPADLNASVHASEVNSIVWDRTRGITLPEPVQTGCAIELIREGGERVRVILRFSPAAVAEKTRVSVLLRNRSGNRLVKQFPAERADVLEFTSSDLSTGPNQVIVYGATENILASRTFLMGQVPRVSVKMTNLQDHYSARDTISVGVHLSSPAGEPDSARFSLSVCRSGTYLSERTSNSMVRNLQPGGLVPELLPIDPPPDMEGVADLMWIARSGNQGIHWKDHLEQIRFLPEMEGEIVAGTVVDRYTGLPMAHRRLFLSFMDTTTSLMTGLTDSSGRFFLPLDPQTGGKELVIRLPGEEQDARILVEDEFSTDPLPEIDPIRLTGEDEAIFQEMFIHQQLNRAFGINHDTILGKEPPAGELFGSYDQHIVMEDYIRLPVMEEVFRELGKSVMLLREGKGYRVLVIDRQSNRIIGDDPLYFLDGIPFTDPEVLLQLDPLQLKDIRFKCSRYFIKDLILDGIIDIRSVSGDPPLPELAGSFARLHHFGLPMQEDQFRADPLALTNRNIPLDMTTLFYKPGAGYRSGENNSLQFVAPDSKGMYDMVIKVLDADGNAGEALFSFRVE